ncbi:MAG: hypothetical protein LPJ89_01860 [Hymenobacteraceae bacterium]|nr:hypothetical protein [Hymenobacteraceae bacterium]MDX5396690.1 hypothetical protein [Hymenobacteraceae bacterium]MDX5442508.1 hypothetical protein [Hymenobacteraceae bacterium]MDX5512750.1 hypothetical protein [Hymenobacteraceae bacterium]
MAFNIIDPQATVKKQNSVRQAPEQEVPRPKGVSIFQLLDRFVKVDWFFSDGLPVQYLPYVLFVMLLAILYIGNTHYAERTIRKIDKTKVETEDLRADYTTLKSDYMEASKQSEVARNISETGIVESSSPPYQIIVSEDEY